MKLVIKYKDYDTHIRTRLFMGTEEPTHVGSLIFQKEEFNAFKATLERGAGSELQFSLIEVVDCFQVSGHGPADL